MRTLPCVVLSQNVSLLHRYKLYKRDRGYPSFGIQHFAGEVEYNATNFLEKNRDSLAPGCVAVLQQSGIETVRDLFLAEITATGQMKLADKATTEAAAGGTERRGETLAPGVSANTANRRTPTLTAQFKNSLEDLMSRMMTCYPHFIRCIKPNDEQQSDNFMDDFVRTQLRYTGVLEATRIRQEGYAWRPSFAEFVRRFKILGFPYAKLAEVKESRASAEVILRAVKLKDYHVGETKLFLKFYHPAEMEKQLKAFFDGIVRLQSFARALKARRRFKRLLDKKNATEAERKRMEEEDRLRREKERQEELERKRLAAEQAQAEKERMKLVSESKKHELELERLATDKARAEAAALEAKVRGEESQAAEIAEAALLEATQALEAEQRALQLASEKEEENARLAKLAQEREEEVKTERLQRQASRKKKLTEQERLRAELEALAQEKARIEAMEAAANARLNAIDHERQTEEARRKEEAYKNVGCARRAGDGWRVARWREGLFTGLRVPPAHGL